MLYFSEQGIDLDKIGELMGKWRENLCSAQEGRLSFPSYKGMDTGEMLKILDSITRLAKIEVAGLIDYNMVIPLWDEGVYLSEKG